MFVVFVITAIVFEIHYQTSDNPFDQDHRGQALGILLIGTLVFLAYRGLTRGRDE